MSYAASIVRCYLPPHSTPNLFMPDATAGNNFDSRAEIGSMELDPGTSRELQKEILLSFHTQFAENQRSREDSFLKFLALLGAVLAGYAFLFQRTPGASNVTNSKAALLLFQSASAAVLFSGARLVVTISNNFRRDQHVNVRIRQACGLIGDGRIFPESYDPANGLRTWGLYSWMPDFLRAFYWLFILFQIGGLVAFGVLAELGFSWPPDTGYTAVCLGSITLIGWSLSVVPWKYRAKLLEVMKLDPDEFGLLSVIRARLRSAGSILSVGRRSDQRSLGANRDEAQPPSASEKAESVLLREPRSPATDDDEPVSKRPK
jgi:hypothetical protein